MRIEEVLNDGGIIRKRCTVCHAALSVKTDVLVNTTLHCDLSREALEPHAHVTHVRTDDKH